jgi:hypothetical protein
VAFFLDPELARLVEGSSSGAPAKTAPASGTRRPNKFGKKCHGCGTWVKPQEGYLGKDGGAWVVYCTTCP